MVSTYEGQYIILPRVGVRADAGPARDVLVAMARPRSTGPRITAALEAAAGREVIVVDTISEDGPKLVEIDDEAAAALNAPDSPVRVERVIEYARPDPRMRLLSHGPPPGGVTNVELTCADADTGDAVVDAHVVAYTSFAEKLGAEGDTDASGKVILQLSGNVIERLYVYPPAGYWGAFQAALPIAASIPVQMTPVDLSFTDCVRHYYGASNFDAQTGVRVGVIDTGVGPHVDVDVADGTNTVTGEPATEIQDGGLHGTHVAGLIASNNTPPNGLRGVAPGVTLNAYRVFGAGATGASNYAILKALMFAASDGCDIVNLSLGGGPFDVILSDAITDARESGMLVIVAAGNDGRLPVSYPAAYTGATAVTALGREGTFPAGSLEEGDVQRPPTGSDPDEFIAAFSNVGRSIGVTAPGVGALSTLPNNEFGPLGGTSMAAPVAAGAAACLLSQNGGIYAMARDQARSAVIEQLLQANSNQRQLGAFFEGYGLPKA